MSAQNHNEGKPSFGYLIKDMPEFIEGVTRVRMKNTFNNESERTEIKKYHRDNWTQSIGGESHQKFVDENIESMFRHLFAMWQGEEYDEDGELHSDHLGCRAGFHTVYVRRNADTVEMEDTTLDSGNFIPKPTYRESLKRGNEMQAWLIELITERHNVGELFPDCTVSDLFSFDESPEGHSFWSNVYGWQYGIGRHPERPKK